MHAPNGFGEAVAYIHDQHAKPRSASLGAKTESSYSSIPWHKL